MRGSEAVYRKRGVYTLSSVLSLYKQRCLVVMGSNRYIKCAHKTDREYQFWQEGVHAEMVFSDAIMRKKLDYIHQNPVKRGYVDKAEHWRSSRSLSENRNRREGKPF